MGDSQGNTSAPYIRPHDGDAWAGDAAKQGRRGTQQLLAAETIAASDSVRTALDLAPGDQVVVRRRLILADDVPVELADSYYPASIAARTALAERGKIKGGAISVLASLDHAPAVVTETITARLAEVEEAQVLDIQLNDPLIILSRVSKDARGVPVELAVNRMVASRNLPIEYTMQVDG